MAEMNEIAIKRGWTQKKWDAYKRWMYTKYGWRDWMVADTEATMNDYERVLARAEKYPPTIGADVLPGETAPAAPKAAAPPTATTVETEVPLPRGVTLTGERKFVGENEYGKGSDGKWYQLKLTPPEGVAPPNVISSGGYDWILTPDITGSGQDIWERIGITRDEEETTSIAEQQWKISQNRREWAPGVNIEQDITTGKLYRPGSMVEVSPDIANSELLNAQTGQIDWQKGATEADLAERRRQFDILQRQKAGEFEREQSLLPQRMALQWELDRQRLLAGLPSEDWVTRGILELELKYANPYKQQVGEGGGMAGDVASLGSQLDRQTGQVQALEQIVVSRGLATGWDSPETQAAKAEMEEAQERRDATYQAWSEVKKEAADWSPQPPPQRQKYPFAPEWLPQWASGQVAGREISPENVMTPSGQQLTQMPQSRASQLGYYADWTARMGKGRSWRDILGEAEIMQPLTPRGAGATRWSPARM